MRTFWEVLALGRSRVPGFVLVAVLMSLGTASSLVEPWIYRAIIDDVAGVFVEPAPLARVESALGKPLERAGAGLHPEDLSPRAPAAPRFFTSGASGAIAHQIDQSDQVAPIFAAVSQETWPELFALVTVFAILFSVNGELAGVVLLARAFVARPAILVLDEATANLDFRTEAQVCATGGSSRTAPRRSS
jgi:hypothetical protein